MSAAEAARLTLTEADDGTSPSGRTTPATPGRELRQALDDLDEIRRAEHARQRLSEFSPRPCSRTSCLPYLHGSVSTGRAVRRRGQEQFAGQTHPRQAPRTREGVRIVAPAHVLLACASGEQHDLGLIALGVALRARGWRITYLGQDTPLDACPDCRLARPEAIVISSVSPDVFRGRRPEFRRWPASHRCRSRDRRPATLSPGSDATFLDVDPVAAADR